jgi:IS30 family transposase
MDFLLVCKLLRQAWSPEQIVGHIRRFNLMARRISHETIYQYIWRDKANGGSLWTHLRQSTKRRRKRYNAYDSRGRLATKRNIIERPKSVETRKYKGHWEIDTVHGRGSTHCIVTLLERKTGYVMIGKLPDKSTAALNKKTIRLINRDPFGFKTITADNGTEFHQYKKIEECHDVTFYFANPYHSWERGSNENVNGLIRQYLPKTESMQTLTQRQCDRIADKLNRRPRKRYGFKTPEEMYYGI